MNIELELLVDIKGGTTPPQFDRELFNKLIDGFDVTKFIDKMSVCEVADINDSSKYISKISFIENGDSEEYISAIVGVTSTFAYAHHLKDIDCDIELSFYGFEDRVCIVEYHEMYNPDINGSINTRIDRCKQVLQHVANFTPECVLELETSYTDPYDPKIAFQLRSSEKPYGYIISDINNEQEDIAAILVTRNILDVYLFTVIGSWFADEVGKFRTRIMSVSAVLTNSEFDDMVGIGNIPDNMRFYTNKKPTIQ